MSHFGNDNYNEQMRELREEQPCKRCDKIPYECECDPCQECGEVADYDDYGMVVCHKCYMNSPKLQQAAKRMADRDPANQDYE